MPINCLSSQLFPNHIPVDQASIINRLQYKSLIIHLHFYHLLSLSSHGLSALTFSSAVYNSNPPPLIPPCQLLGVPNSCIHHHHPIKLQEYNRSASTCLLQVLVSSDPRRSLASWNDSIHFCLWPSVTCSGRRHPQRVISVNLSFLDLVGSISPAIANLTFLRKIDLSNNQFHGSIPQEIGHLFRLQHLNLSMNSIEGGIPGTLSRCSQLQTLRLNDNMLKGEVPSNLSDCSDLQIIVLRNNSLTGYVPASLANLSSLAYLDLSSNKLTGGIPPNIGQQHSLTMLFLDHNELSGSIPPDIGNLTSLTDLDLSTNSLRGSIPPIIGNLYSLIGFSLADNQLSGGIPPSFGKLSKLKQLLLSFNDLSGVIPPSLWNMSSLSNFEMAFNYHLLGSLPPNIGQSLPFLESIYLAFNQFHGPIPLSLSNASRLEFIDLSGNRFSGTVPPNLGNLQKLQWLGLGINHLEVMEPDGWSFLAALTNCTHLKKLHLQSNNLGGMLPSSIANLSTKLEILLMSDNYIAGKISPNIGNLANLTTFAVDSNFLTGSIPASMGMLQRMHVLALSSNKLFGEIPFTIGNLTQLNSVYLDFNELDGNIPASLGNCQNLEVLSLTFNKLTGSIPKEVLTIPTFSKGLYLKSNLLTGLIPAEVGNMRNLESIDVSMNKLSGEIPSTLGDCQELRGLSLGQNFLQGSIPTSLRSLRGIEKLDISKNNLSGKIPAFLQDSCYLRYLNLSFNNFEGNMPILGIFRNASEVSVIGNNKLCGGNPEMHLPACPSPSPNKKHYSHTLVLIIVIASSFLFLIMVFCFLGGRVWMKSSRRKPHDSTPVKEQYEKVSYAELVKATNGFSTDNIIGTGSFGTVYKGILDSRKVVAVKVLNLETEGASKSFVAECEAFKNIRHRNLVKILTTCSSVDFRGNEFKAVVFEFMANGSLDDWLHPKEYEQFKPKRLNLIQRLNIAIDVASALDYIHHYVETPIIHCDLKPSNVLLDEYMTARVGDFGLARFRKHIVTKSSQPSTSSAGLRGTIGYVAPEYGVANKVSTHGDVYSYGILLLEMFTARRPTGDTFTGGLSLRSFVEMAFPAQITDVIDPHFLSPADGEESDDAQDMISTRAMDCIASMLRIGLSCSNQRPADRMEMADVIRELHKVMDEFLRNGIKFD